MINPRSNFVVIRINDPMAYISEILLGRITKISGYEGAVTVKLEKSFTENIPDLESVFLEIDGRPVPFFISDSEYSGADILKLRFEGYNSIEKVSEYVGCRVFLTSGTTETFQTDNLSTLAAYTVFTKDDILLGSITEIIQNPGQWLLTIMSPGNKEILIPLHEDFIVSIDNLKKIVVMDIPDGLTDIN
jgi:16S rRNA processing protein RimM